MVKFLSDFLNWLYEDFLLFPSGAYNYVTAIPRYTIYTDASLHTITVAFTLVHKQKYFSNTNTACLETI